MITPGEVSVSFITVVDHPVPVRFPFESYAYDSVREPVTPVSSLALSYVNDAVPSASFSLVTLFALSYV